jgi:uncharacterized protein (DUF3820 family)
MGGTNGRFETNKELVKKAMRQEHQEKIDRIAKKNTKMPFGKYEGLSIAYIAKNDRDYLLWLRKQTWLGEKLKAWINLYLIED